MGIFDIFKRKEKSTEFKCSTCGQVHDELPALGFLSPLYYDTLNEKDKKEIAELSTDFCKIKHEDQTDRFIRTTLTIKINDACEDLDYGIWVSLSEKSFNEYQSEFKNNVEGKTYFGMISNEIPDYEESTLGIHVNVNTRSGGIRPEIIPHQNEHKLISDWENGINIKEAEKRIERMTNSLTEIKPEKFNKDQIRIEFKKFVGNEKYNHFILTLYEAFPLREKLFFWQEELLKNFSNEFDIEPILFENVHEIFNHCPIHDFELKKDNVKIVDGNDIIPKISYEREKELFPMANINAPRDLERFNYPKDVDVVYCEKCRELKNKNVAQQRV